MMLKVIFFSKVGVKAMTPAPLPDCSTAPVSPLMSCQDPMEEPEPQDRGAGQVDRAGIAGRRVDRRAAGQQFPGHVQAQPAVGAGDERDGSLDLHGCLRRWSGYRMTAVRLSGSAVRISALTVCP